MSENEQTTGGTPLPPMTDVVKPSGEPAVAETMSAQVETAAPMVEPVEEPAKYRDRQSVRLEPEGFAPIALTLIRDAEAGEVWQTTYPEHDLLRAAHDGQPVDKLTADGDVLKFDGIAIRPAL